MRLIPLAAALLLGADAASAESANHYLATPDRYKGKEIKLDVLFVRPVRVQSSIPGVQWFHAFTEDDKTRALGGAILVALPEATVAKFVDEFGLARSGRTEKLRGFLHALPNRARASLPVWFVDYKGLNADLIARFKNATLDAEAPATTPPTRSPRSPSP